MKNLFLIVTFLFISCSKSSLTLPSEPNPEVKSVQTLGGTNNEAAISITKTSDGGYAILGFAQSNDGDIIGKTNTSYDFYVLKYNATNKLEWSKTYGGSDDDRGNKIIQTDDNGFLILGSTKSNDGDITENAGDRDYWLAKLDSNGALHWQKSYGFVGKDFGTSLTRTNDGNYILVGELDVTASNGEGNSRTAQRHAGGDYWVIKIDGNGNKLWSKYYGGSFTDTPQDIVPTIDGGFIIAGFSDSTDVDITNNKGTYDFWIIKISATGDLVWEKNFGGSQIDEAKSIVSTNDNSFIIVGDTRSTDKDISSNNGGADLWAIKIDGSGNLLWKKTFGGSNFDVARAINPTNDGGFVIAGSSRSLDNGFTNNGQNDAWVLKISSEGNQEWQQIVGGSNIDFLYDVVQLQNGNIIAVGESSSSDKDLNENKGFSDVLIINIQ